jgi:hypothetical protein
MIVFGPSWLIESRSDWSKPRIRDVIPTMDVIPMTTPSTVSAERILLARSVCSDMMTISWSRPARSPAITRASFFPPRRYSRLKASIGSSLAACIAG